MCMTMTTNPSLPRRGRRPMAMIIPSLSRMRMQTSEQKAVYDHGLHPVPFPKEVMIL